eukprot:6354960-Pyramimonas_sp.AAC.2
MTDPTSPMPMPCPMGLWFHELVIPLFRFWDLGPGRELRPPCPAPLGLNSGDRERSERWGRPTQTLTLTATPQPDMTAHAA